MKGKDLINTIKENNLEDFDVEIIFTDGYNVFPNIRSLKISGIADVGYSSNIVYLDGEED